MQHALQSCAATNPFLYLFLIEENPVNKFEVALAHNYAWAIWALEDCNKKTGWQVPQ